MSNYIRKSSFTTCINHTGGKFARDTANVIDSGGKLPTVSTKLVANNGNSIRMLKVNIFEKIRNGPNELLTYSLLRGLGETDS
jgi:hypothetical protein